MTEEQYIEASRLSAKIFELERMCRFDHINANGYLEGPVEIGLMTKEEFRTILNEANEKIRERARKALELARQEFDAL